MRDFLVFDLETQRSAQEVGGWDHIADMKLSVGVVYDSRDQRFYTYFEGDLIDLIAHLKSGPLVIGYNHLRFDYLVLAGYAPLEEREEAMAEYLALDNLDLLVDIKDRIGKRIKLDDLVRPTLGAAKSADGLTALQWYQEYLEGQTERLGMIADYCKQDVEVTRDLYLHGLKHKRVNYLDRDRGLIELAVDWGHNLAPEDETQLPLF